MSIGSQIVSRRKQIGMTQQTLAEKLDVSFQAVSSWERDEYLPETEKLKSLAASLNTTVSFLMEEKIPQVNQWELHNAMFSIENMLRRVRMYSQGKKYTETQKAIKLMLLYHEGGTRKSNNGEEVPYIIHPLMMACHAFALGIDSDELIATILLHDVVEDTKATLDELNVNEKIRQAVDLLSFNKIEGVPKEESYQVYYEKIGRNQIASIVKLLDRCNNISTMATGFKPEKMAEYIIETETYVLPLLEKVKHEYGDYFDAAFLLKYQMVKDNFLTADDVLKLGKEIGIDLFSVALEVRCLKELGLAGVPEWCTRDGVLPTAEQIS